MTLFKREMTSGSKSLLIWIVVTSLLVALSLSMFQSFASQADEVNELMASFSPEMLEALNAGNIDFGNALEYFAYIYQYVLLAACIMAMLISVSALAKEEGDSTIEFLYAKPVTKTQILLQKLLSVVVQMAIYTTVVMLISYIMLVAFSGQEVSLLPILLVGVVTYLAQLFFAGLGFLISVFVTKTRLYTPVSMGVVMALYFLGMVANVSEEIKLLANVTPFAFFNINQVVKSEIIEGPGVFIALITFVAMAILTYFMYNRKDFAS